MTDFTKCAVGTTVYSVNLGKGKIIKINKSIYLIVVEFERAGKLIIGDENPSLFLQKPKIVFEEGEIEKQFYIGDKVRIASKEATEKSHYKWVEEMDGCLGKTGEVIGKATGIRVNVGGHGNWSFHPSDLEQVPYEFKVGDWVVPTGRKIGTPIWNSDGEMDKLIGKTIRVTEIGGSVDAGIPMDRSWYWNPLELRPAKRKKF